MKLLRDCWKFVNDTASLEKSLEFLDAKSKVNGAQKAVSNAYKNLKNAEKQNNEQLIEEANQKCEDEVWNRDNISNRLKYYLTTRKIEGGKELKSLLESLEKSRKKDFTKAQFIFMRAIKTYAGDFNKNNGQLELTNARGIKALSFRNNIYDEVKGAFNDDPYINEAMEFWHQLLNLLFEILVIFKVKRNKNLKISCDWRNC